MFNPWLQSENLANQRAAVIDWTMLKAVIATFDGSSSSESQNTIIWEGTAQEKSEE